MQSNICAVEKGNYKVQPFFINNGIFYIKIPNVRALSLSIALARNSRSI